MVLIYHLVEIPGRRLMRAWAERIGRTRLLVAMAPTPSRAGTSSGMG